MSPLWRDETGIFIGPGKIILARMARGLNPRFVASDSTSVSHENAGDWSPACDTLASMLDDESWQDANARVVISDHWARYVSLPWNDEIRGEDERLAQARLILGATYGELSEQWTVKVGGDRPGTPALVSAVPADLLERLDEIARATNLRLLSVQPNLVAVFNTWRTEVDNEAAWFASVDEGSLATIRVRKGRCARVESVRVSGDWSLELQRIRAMSLLRRDGAGRIYLDAPAVDREACQIPDADIEWLEPDAMPRNTTTALLAMRGTM